MPVKMSSHAGESKLGQELFQSAYGVKERGYICNVTRNFVNVGETRGVADGHPLDSNRRKI
jgi:hypothetical protein